MHRTFFAATLCALATAACGSAVSPGDGGTTDGAITSDGARPGDAGGGSDAPQPPLDGGVVPDADPPIDGGGPPDGPVVPDANPPDAQPDTLVGQWRLVRWETRNADGSALTLTDTNTTQTFNGVMLDVRANGLLTVTSSRIALSFGALVNDHFFVRQDAPTFDESFSATGYAAPGTASGYTFTFPGGANRVVFTRNADGTITTTDMTSGARSTFARATPRRGVAMINAQGQATMYRPMTATPIARPRMALAWDRPGVPDVSITDDQAIRFGALGSALYNVRVSAPPAEAIGTIGGTRVALALAVVYDDVNNNGRLDTGDEGRGASSVGIAWREGAASPAFLASAFRDVEEGLQYVNVHNDFSTSRPTVHPWDPANPVAPDIPVSPTRLGGALPDIIR